MKTLFKRSFLLLPLLLLLIDVSKAEVYSVVTWFAKLEGYEDCWKINYSIFESHGTTNMTDDTNLGNYSCIVGSDCGSTNHSPIAVELTEASHSVYKFNTYPNPVSGQLHIDYFQDSNDGLSWSWYLISETNEIVQAGTEILSNKSEFTITTSGIKSGKYSLIFISHKGDIQSSQVIIIQ